MIVKSKYVSARTVSPGKASSALKSHLKYIQYRERGENETREDRQLFRKEHDRTDRHAAYAGLLRDDRAGDIYYHRLILSPGNDEPVQDYQQWTRNVMHDLEQNQGKELEWYATVHQNTDNPHVHVVVSRTGINRDAGTAEPVTFSRQDFQVLRESGRDHSDYHHYQQIEHTLNELDRDDQREQRPERDEPAFVFPGSQREGLER